jgi:putative MATE family efflux protein
VRDRNREILSLAVPALLTLAIDPLVSIVDTAFVAGLGTTSLAALGVCAAIFMVAFLLSNFLSYGITPLISEALGLSEEQEARTVSSEAMLIASLIGTVVMGALWLWQPYWLGLMGAADGELAAAASDYLEIRLFAAPAVFLVTAGNGIYRGYKDTRTPLYIAVVVNAVNVLLDGILILGLGWGLAGAAWATLIAQWLGAAAFFGLGVRSSRLVWVPRPRLSKFFRIGWVLGARTLSIVGTMAVATSVATRIGTHTVAAHQVVTQLWFLLALLIDSLAVAAQILVPRRMAAQEWPELRALTRQLWLWGVLGGLVLSLVTAAMLFVLPEWFSQEQAVIDDIRSAMFLVIFVLPIGGLVFVGDGIFLGAKRFGFLAATCSIGAVVSAYFLLVWCEQLRDIWAVILAFVGFRCISMLVEWRRTDGRLRVPAQ